MKRIINYMIYMWYIFINMKYDIYIYVCERIEPLPLAADCNSQLHQEENSVPNTRNQMVNAIEGNPVPNRSTAQCFSRKQWRKHQSGHPMPNHSLFPPQVLETRTRPKVLTCQHGFYGSQVSHQGTQVVDISHSSTFLLMRHWKTSRKDYGFCSLYQRTACFLWAFRSKESHSS